LIDPEAIPQYTGNLPQLEQDHAALKKDAGKVRQSGAEIHSRFQGLSAYYQAPEAEQLFASTMPVKERADDFADDLETVSSALSEYATEIRPLVKKLEQLKVDASKFVSENADDDEWQYDGDKVEEHNALRSEITATVAAFWAAERTCHNKITALWNGTQMTAGDGSDRKDQYGFSADDMKNAKLPWGDPVEEKHHWYEVGHWAKSFVWDGLIVDGVWGTIKGLGTLVGFGGWDAMSQAWKGLAQLGTGLALSALPGVGTAFWTLPDDKLPSWLRDSRTAMKETGKSLVAWDEWGRNPGRAAGAATFNVVTTVLTGGAGGAASGAGKAGAAAKVISAAGKAGRVIDPMTYIAKGAGAGLSKIGDIAKNLRGAGNIEIPRLPDEAITIPEGSVRLPDGAVRLPEGATIPDGATRLPDGSVKLPENVPALPEGTVKLPTEASVPAQYLDPDGNILDATGDIVRHTDQAPTDVVGRNSDLTPRANAETPRVEAPAREPALAGAGRGGDSAPGGGGAGNLPGGAADDLARGPSASHEPPSGSHEPPSGSHVDEPGSGVHEGPADGRQAPAGMGDDRLPGGYGDDSPPPPHGGGHEGAGATMPDGPRGNLPDGSWAGENGLRLDKEANAAAEAFMRRSAAAEPRITRSMQGIADSVDHGKLIGLEYRLKGDDSLKRKLATDMLEDIGVAPGRALDDIKDSIRYTMEVPRGSYTRGVQQAIDDLQAKGFQNVTFKNTWDSAGYKGINSTWRDPVSGQVFELQFHTADSFAAKMDGHALYEKERLPGVSADELAAISAEQSELFGKVPVPRDAGSIRLGAPGSDDVAAALGRDADSILDDLGPTSDDVGDLADDVADAGDEAADIANSEGSPFAHGDKGGWSGSGWVEEPSERAASIYESLRATPNHVDIPAMSRNTGIDESVLRQVKTHMIRSQHDVLVQPGEWRRGRFTPRDDLADLWDGARKGTLNADQITEFKHLMTHEYVESRLMKGGLPYLRDETGLWREHSDGTYSRKSPKSLSAAGAHDLAPNPARGGFGRAWQKLGLKHPRTELAADLSNIDEFVNDVVRELRAKGLNLK
jgi:hypothetical protein